jgi:tetratricopeptide (TPR) repeat protein
MKKKMYVSFILVLIFNFSTQFSIAQNVVSKIVKNVDPAIITVFGQDEKGAVISQGSGFFIDSRGQFVTNRHVLAGSSYAIIRVLSGKEYSVSYVVKDFAKHDLLVCKANIEGESINYLPISYELPEIGEDIIVIGAPKGLERTVSNGIVSSVRNDDFFGTLIQITAPISHGSSGSPIIDMNGNVIGIATFNLREGQNLNFAMPALLLNNLPIRGYVKYMDWSQYNLKSIDNNLDFEKGISLYNEFKFREAIRYFKNVLEKNYRYADALGMIGFSYLRLFEYDKAIEFFNEAIKLDSDNESYYHGKSKCYRGKKDYDKALKNIEIAISFQPNDEFLFATRASIKSESGNYNAAIEDYDYVLKLNPNFIHIYHSRGLVKYYKEDYLAAIDDFTISIRKDPEDAKGPYAYRGRCYEELGDFSSAINDYEKAISKDPEWFVPYYFMGRLKAKNEDFIKAIEFFSLAISKNPQDVDSYFQRSNAKYDIGDTRGAIIDLTRVIEMHPTSYPAYLNRGLYKLKLGLKDDGCIDLSKAGELGDMKAYELINKYCR